MCGRGARGFGAEDGHLQKIEGSADATEDPAQGRKGPRPKIILTLT